MTAFNLDYEYDSYLLRVDLNKRKIKKEAKRLLKVL